MKVGPVRETVLSKPIAVCLHPHRVFPKVQFVGHSLTDARVPTRLGVQDIPCRAKHAAAVSWDSPAIFSSLVLLRKKGLVGHRHSEGICHYNCSRVSLLGKGGQKI